MGNSIVLLCMHPSEGTVTRFFFCKDKTLLSVRKAISHLGIYKLSITQDFTGQYSCGYQHRNEMNQETSALSSVRNLMVLSDKKWAIISGVLGFVILILAALIYLLVKKDVFCQRLLQQEETNPRTHPTIYSNVSHIRNNSQQSE
ncbi:uncharacterized protein PHA67_018529 isoform 3-T3 [Liasis olivaceus]